MSKLSLEEVTNILGISTDSVLNHIKKDRLTASTIKNKGEVLYVFDFDDIKVFALEYLDMKIAQQHNDRKKNFEFEDDVDDIPVKKTKSTKSNIHNVNEEPDTQVLKEFISNLQEDYTNAMKQLTDYKEQAAFQIGQLKSQLETTQKTLMTGKKDIEEREMRIRKLKQKLKEMQSELEEEKNALESMSLFERVFKVKKTKRQNPSNSEG